MIRFPKKNIAERSVDRTSKLVQDETLTKSHKGTELPKEDKDSSVIPLSDQNTIIEKLRRFDPSTVNRYAGILYPEKLVELYKDIDLYHYGKLNKEEREALSRRMPVDLLQAEAMADKLLYKFVEDAIKALGPKHYFDLVKEGLNHRSKVLMALRCMIAAYGNQEPETLEIFRNQTMNAYDFFSPNHIIQQRLENGEILSYLDTTNEDAYERSKSIKSTKHQRIIKNHFRKKFSKRDQMPFFVLEASKEEITALGYEVPENLSDAWSMLDQQSKKSTIEERIIGRIAYLMANAANNQKPHLLENRQEITGN